MYELQVFVQGRPCPEHVELVSLASEVLPRVTTLVSQHTDCDRIVVLKENLRLFTVDRHGNPIPD